MEESSIETKLTDKNFALSASSLRSCDPEFGFGVAKM